MDQEMERILQAAREKNEELCAKNGGNNEGVRTC